MPADVLALFDLDHTLLTIDSDEAWVAFLIEQGALDRTTFETANKSLVDRYRHGEAGTVEFTEFYLSTLAGRDVETLLAWRADYVERKIRPAIHASARALVDKHRILGHLLVLTTATSRFLTEPIAHELEIEHLIATEPEVRAGRYTGRVAGTPNMREGKIERLRAWLAEREQDLGDFRETWFYSDSQNDIPLLSLVSHPVAVNADAALGALARARGWPMMEVR